MRSQTVVYESTSFRLVILSAIIFAFTGFGPADLFLSTARATGEPIRVRIGVTEDSIAVVTPADLAAIGIDVAAIDPRTFAMTSLGNPVSIDVTGEADGSFDVKDRLYFFGQRYRSNTQDEKYTDERVYWLTIGGARGARISTIGAAPSGSGVPAADFAATLRAEKNQFWWTLFTLSLDTKDTWFWERLQPGVDEPNPASRTLDLFVPYPAPNTSATVSAEFISLVGRAGAVPDHRTALSLNGQQAFDEAWDGAKVRRVFRGTVPSGTLLHGPNAAMIRTWAVPIPGTAQVDTVYFNYIELQYRRLFRAYEGVLDFTAELPGHREYEVDGWGSQDVLIWDISDDDNPLRLHTALPAPVHQVYLPFVSSAPPSQPKAAVASFSVRFSTFGTAGARYWLQERGTFKSPASLRLRPPTGLANPPAGADTVIVTDAELRPAAERLAEWHRSHGRRTVVADILDVYDEFGDGIHHPRAIQMMLADASTGWVQPAPAFLTLVGDGHWNIKGYNTTRYPNPTIHIPPYLSWLDPWQGEVPTDDRFGDVDDDGRPEIAVGRLAVNSLPEANLVVDKIVNYDETVRSATWQKKALFVSDNPDSAGNFPAAADEIVAGYTPSDLQIVRAYLPAGIDSLPLPEREPYVAPVRDVISSTIQSGVWMVQYNGHGGARYWTSDGLWNTEHIAKLSNSDMLPFVMTFNCLDGYFVDPRAPSTSMAEEMQRQPRGGAVAVISPTGLGITAEQQAFRKELLTAMFTDNVRELGAALLLAKQRYYAINGPHYLIGTMTLFGDPALRIPAGQN